MTVKPALESEATPVLVGELLVAHSSWIVLWDTHFTDIIGHVHVCETCLVIAQRIDHGVAWKLYVLSSGGNMGWLYWGADSLNLTRVRRVFA